MKPILAAIAATLALGACAQKADTIAPAYVSSGPYLAMSCQQLATEASSINRRAAELAGKQDKAAGNDTALTAAAIILFWPAAFFIPGGADYSAELAQLRGQAEAITLASGQKGCGA